MPTCMDSNLCTSHDRIMKPKNYMYIFQGLQVARKEEIVIAFLS
jgi:hypothetical protein